MTAAAIDLAAAFRSHCEARAALYGAGKIYLHDAVDGLQAIAGPLIDTIGQDAVQQIMSEAFKPYREREWNPPPTPPTSPATDDAMLYSLRRGLSCLSDPNCLDRLARCDEAAIRAIAAELLTWPGVTADGKPRPWLPAWTQDDIDRVLVAWHSARGMA